MPAFLNRSAKQFSTGTGNETRFVTKIQWIIESVEWSNQAVENLR